MTGNRFGSSGAPGERTAYAIRLRGDAGDVVRGNVIGIGTGGEDVGMGSGGIRLDGTGALIGGSTPGSANVVGNTRATPFVGDGTPAAGVVIATATATRSRAT